MKHLYWAPAAALLLSAGMAHGQSNEARKFGARESIEGIALSPDGTRIAYLQPGPGSATIVYVADAAGGTPPKRVTWADSKPEKLRSCRWSAADRIVCQLAMFVRDAPGLVGYTRMVAMNADGSDIKLLSKDTSSRSLGVAQSGGDVIDWLPETDGQILMTRTFVPEQTIGTRLADSRKGYGVERLDTRTLKRTTVEQPRNDAAEFLTDGHGTVRIMGMLESSGVGYATGKMRYFYRLAGKSDWNPLSTVDLVTGTGFNPVAVDRDLNAVYGFDDKDGRTALYRVVLDGTQASTLVFQHPQVDVDGLIRVGRQRRVVGASFATDKREAQFFDPELKRVAASLSKALPGLPLVRIVDASTDENKLLLWAGSDKDPGRYYVFDRKAKALNEIMLSRPELEGAVLAEQKAITFKAADGTEIPAYLTLPPGSTGKNLPAIVMPHGGPGARDEWGFDWLSQFFASRGYAVLQPNFRGSAGYGESWFVDNGFKSWKIAIGDVNDGGRWLTAQGIADPAKLAIVGWSYGGYAALQSPMLDPALFKAIVAIAPVTDLTMLREESAGFTNYKIVSDFIGTGPHIDEGSPARNAGKITAPVLLFHGDQDTNVGIGESRLMESRLKAAGKKVELVTYPGLDHYLQDSQVRTGMLDKADTFLRGTLGM
jgi:dipeptidyl aminopeptidase/acylaminoacyl peptidase